MGKRIVISATGLFTPEHSISNEELVASFNQYAAHYNEQHKEKIEAGSLAALAPSSAEFIEKASGIKSRFVVDKAGVLDVNRMRPFIPSRNDETQSIQCEMAVHAIREALRKIERKPEDVDVVIVACSNMQRPYPAVAVEIQHAMKMSGFAYDMNVACSSATFGIQAAYNAIYSGSANCVVVVNPEICSGHLCWTDRDCHFIFGDVCTATVIEKQTHVQKDGFEILDIQLKTEFSSNIRNNFGFLNSAEEKTASTRDKLFYQNGRKVFKEVCPLVVEHLDCQISSMGLKASDVKRLWLHQANINMNQFIAKKVLQREPDEQNCPIILDKYANTSSAGSIIAFHQYQQDLEYGDIGIICSFGAGYSIGSIVVKKVFS